MTPPQTSPSLTRVGHTAAGSRRYRSKAQRPCDLCRARKALCNIPDPARPCQLCDRTGRQCTFLAGTTSRATRSSASNHSADAVDGGADPRQYTASSADNALMEASAGLSPNFEQPSGDGLSIQWSSELEQLGQNETFMQDIPGFWSLPYDDSSMMEAASTVDPTIGNDAMSRPSTQATIDRQDRSTSFIGYSNESDPFLLEHYPYNGADELDFFMVTYRRPSLLGASAGHAPIHFLQSRPQATLQSQEAMAACLTLNNERELLHDLVSVDMGVALLRL